MLSPKKEDKIGKKTEVKWILGHSTVFYGELPMLWPKLPCLMKEKVT